MWKLTGLRNKVLFIYLIFSSLHHNLFGFVGEGGEIPYKLYYYSIPPSTFPLEICFGMHVCVASDLQYRMLEEGQEGRMLIPI